MNKEFLGHGNNEAAIPRGSEATLKQEGWHELIYAEKNLQRSRVHCQDALKYGIKEFGDVEHEHFEESLAWMATLADVGAAVLGGKEGVRTMHQQRVNVANGLRDIVCQMDDFACAGSRENRLSRKIELLSDQMVTFLPLDPMLPMLERKSPDICQDVKNIWRTKQWKNTTASGSAAT